MPGKIRVVIAKAGLDGHDRGAKIIARALRDAGMEVIYTGLHQTPEQVVETAVQEDADAVGISILSGAHMTLVPRILELLRDNGAEDVLVVVGGTIPNDDADELKRQGVAAVFTPGAPTSEIVDFLRGAVPGEVLQPVAQFLERRPVERVHRLRPVDRDGRNRAVALDDDAQAGTFSRKNSTISDVGAPGVKTAATPCPFSSSASSAGIVPPSTTSTSSAPFSRSPSRIRGTSVMCAPERIEIPTASASSWIAVSTICSGV